MRISVVTVAWNAAATIGDTLRSVAAQDYGEVEHIIIDGGSTDATAAVAATAARPGATFISQPDNGLYDAMNRGIERATGDLVGFLNADDFFCRTDALTLVATAADAAPRAAAVAAGVAMVDPIDTRRLRRAYPAHVAPWRLRLGHMPPHPGFYVRRAALTQVGGFDLAAGTAADFDWMVRFFLIHRLRAVRLTPTLVTMRAGGVSNAGLASYARANSHAAASLRRHRYALSARLLWAKYLMKAAQLVAPACDWPAPAAVRWQATESQRRVAA